MRIVLRGLVGLALVVPRSCSAPPLLPWQARWLPVKLLPWQRSSPRSRRTRIALLTLLVTRFATATKIPNNPTTSIVCSWL
jgi:hypothetical protein